MLYIMFPDPQGSRLSLRNCVGPPLFFAKQDIETVLCDDSFRRGVVSHFFFTYLYIYLRAKISRGCAG